MIGGSSNAVDLLLKLNRQLEHLTDLTTPLQASGDIVRDASVMRIKEQGGDLDWPPNKRGGHTGVDSGRMMGTIQVAPPNPNSVTVSDDVAYARYFQEGTGIYAGHQPWVITGNPGLKFTIGGKTYIRRSVVMPGQPGRVFLTIEQPEKNDILAVFDRWVSGENL
jgi:hypothetical protein